jgi:hypothetical protein
MPESVNAIYDLGKVLLVIKICQLENKTLLCHEISHIQRVRLDRANLRETNVPDEVKEHIDVVRMAKIQFWCLLTSKSVSQMLVG